MARTRRSGAATAVGAAGAAQAVRPLQPRARLAGLGAQAMSAVAAHKPWSKVADARSVELDAALDEIERELRRRLDPVERVAIAFALERFAERWPRGSKW